MEDPCGVATFMLRKKLVLPVLAVLAVLPLAATKIGHLSQDVVAPPDREASVLMGLSMMDSLLVLLMYQALDSKTPM
jgi:hypothetical protein